MQYMALLRNDKFHFTILDPDSAGVIGDIDSIAFGFD